MESQIIMTILQNDFYSKTYNSQFCLVDTLPTRLEDNRIYVVFTTSRGIPRPSQNNVILGHIFSIDTIQKKSNQIPVLTVFDSYGRFNADFPPSRIRRIILSYCKRRKASLHFNNRCYQPPRTMICSHLTLYFLLQRSRGHGLSRIQKLKFCINQGKLSFLIPKMINGLIPQKSKKERLLLAKRTP